MNTLIVGFGSIGKKHAEILTSLGCTVDLVTSQTIDQYKTFTKLSTVDFEKYGYIIKANATNKHIDDLQFIDSKTHNKIILVEKPIFMDKQRYEPKNNQIFVAYNLRFTNIIGQIKSLISDKKALFCGVYTGSYLPNWREGIEYSKRYSAKKEEGGGVLLDLSHEIVYLQWLLGDFDILFGINNIISNLNINSDDVATFIAKTNLGCIVNCTIDYICKLPKRDITIHTDEFTIIADLVNGILKLISSDGESTIFEYKDDTKHSYFTMHKNILASNFDFVCKYTDGLKVLKTIESLRNV